MRENAQLVAAQAPDPSPMAIRTLWHSYYDTEKRSVEVDFYLGEGATPGTVRRSESTRVRL